MATLTVWKYSDPGAADVALDKLKGLQTQELISIEDAAIVRWPEGRRKPKTEQMYHLAGMGALDGFFWGALFGVLFLVPVFGMAVGAATGALAGGLSDVGIDDDFIKSVRSQVTEGTSALFVLTSGAVVDRVHDEMGDNAELIASNLSDDQQKKLTELFSKED